MPQTTATVTTLPVKKGKRDNVVGGALLVIHLVALLAFLPQFFSWSAVAAAFVLYVLTGGGITLVYHRLLTHKSMSVPKPVEYVLTVIAALALQGGPLEWVANHRAHHAHSDHDGDPHDTHKGMPWAHVEWLYRANEARVPESEWPRWVPDLLKDKGQVWIEKSNFLLQVALGVALFFIGGWSWVIWGIFARLVFTYHCTWLVNSASHAKGYRTYRTDDKSQNNWFVALLTFGEGWHNNHHAFPFSAKHGMAWFELDPTYWTIRAMEKLGLASNVKIPTPEMLERLAVNKTKGEAAA